MLLQFFELICGMHILTAFLKQILWDYINSSAKNESCKNTKSKLETHSQKHIRKHIPKNTFEFLIFLAKIKRNERALKVLFP